MNFILALVAAAAYGVSDFVGGYASRKSPALQLVAISTPFSAILLLILAGVLNGGDSLASLEPRAILFGAASGISLSIAVWSLFLALSEGTMSVVSPITSVLAAIVPVLIGLLLGEHLSVLVIVGILCAMVSVVLVSQESKQHELHHTLEQAESAAHTVRPFSKRIVFLTVAAGLGFGMGFVLTHQIGNANAGLWPMAIAKVVASIILWLIALRSADVGLPKNLAIFKYPLVIASLDAIAVISMLKAFHGSYVSIISVLISLYPFFTTALAIVLLHERINHIQKAGIALAACAIALIAYAS